MSQQPTQIPWVGLGRGRQRERKITKILFYLVRERNFGQKRLWFCGRLLYGLWARTEIQQHHASAISSRFGIPKKERAPTCATCGGWSGGGRVFVYFIMLCTCMYAVCTLHISVPNVTLFRPHTPLAISYTGVFTPWFTHVHHRTPETQPNCCNTPRRRTLTAEGGGGALHS